MIALSHGGGAGGILQGSEGTGAPHSQREQASQQPQAKFPEHSDMLGYKPRDNISQVNQAPAITFVLKGKFYPQ